MIMMLTLSMGPCLQKEEKKIKRKKWEEWAQTRARKQLNLTETYTPAHSVNLSSSECTGVCKKEHTQKKISLERWWGAGCRQLWAQQQSLIVFLPPVPTQLPGWFFCIADLIKSFFSPRTLQAFSVKIVFKLLSVICKSHPLVSACHLSEPLKLLKCRIPPAFLSPHISLRNNPIVYPSRPDSQLSCHYFANLLFFV